MAMPKFDVSVVLANGVWEDEPGDMVEALGKMDAEAALDYVCEMAADPDMKQLARHGWVLDDVFEKAPTADQESCDAPLGTKERPFYFEAVLSREVEAETAALAEAAVQVELDRLLRPGGILEGWEVADKPLARAKP